VASYPVIEPDHVREAAENLIAVTRDSLELIALPPKRILLGEAADALERLMREKATT
jgi:hypothetical protein